MYTQPCIRIRRLGDLIPYLYDMERSRAARFFFKRELTSTYRGTRGPWFLFWFRSESSLDTEAYYAHLSQWEDYLGERPIVAAVADLDVRVYDITPAVQPAARSQLYMSDLSNVQIVKGIPVPR